jgi:hypothetical protein
MIELWSWSEQTFIVWNLEEKTCGGSLPKCYTLEEKKTFDRVVESSRTWIGQGLGRRNFNFFSNYSFRMHYNLFVPKEGHKHTKPPKNCSHKYNIAIIFFSNVWKSHFALFLLVLSIFD